MVQASVQARLHRWVDTFQAFGHPDRQALHRQIRAILAEAQQSWPSADYGSGYLYQSCPALGLHGFRHTDARLAALDIGDRLKGRRVLEVGCNTGFLSLALAGRVDSLYAFDNNPYLIRIAQLAQRALGVANVTFATQRFEDLAEDTRFDAALSFANHSTWDGNLRLPLETYFAKLQRLLVPAGLLLFESHHPALENAEQLDATLQILAQYFRIEDRRPLDRGSAWDRGRTLVRARSLRDD